MASTTAPEHYNAAVIPHIAVADAAEAIAFYGRAFAATELFRLTDDDGSIFHAEISVAGSTLMLSDPHPPFGPPVPGAPPVALHVYVDDVDALAARAVAAGARLDQAPADQFYGARTAILTDPFHHLWVFLQQLEPAQSG
ncbi:VOC family protein [Actinocorallia sp. A-T 12471]|uniref:VOC family protein n=1 Tax=Actinocorallia sp. A-T 12471 TaxID=3089813 RepID=UPI0029D23778|nr:VOC family protein [Actinocorallia sp. A-T 12471]MDX6739593.1 VOC family protein [Actinocorallia sp. A-T 12471]